MLILRVLDVRPVEFMLSLVEVVARVEERVALALGGWRLGASWIEPLSLALHLALDLVLRVGT